MKGFLGTFIHLLALLDSSKVTVTHAFFQLIFLTFSVCLVDSKCTI